MTTAAQHPLLRVRLPSDRVELVQLQLWELGAIGFEQHDQTTLVRAEDANTVTLTAAFEDLALAEAARDSLPSELNVQLAFSEPVDWATEWRRGFGPQRIGARLLLQPSWEPDDAPGDRAIVTIDPENAFGSGDHETTRLVLSVLDRRIQGGETVLDVGCGSGILSISALRLGARLAIGVDIEDSAIEVARRNAELNGVQPCFDVSRTPLDRVDGRFDVVLANIETRVLTQMPEALAQRVAPGGILVLSGILLAEHDAILASFGSLELLESLSENNWLAYVMRVPSR
ncbi:MAG: 50S ribosomal protein L11 methyltransferase [Myxococcota bacterium]